MRKVIFVNLFVIILFNIKNLYAQSRIDTIELKRGEVFDILLLNRNPNKEEELKSYFKTAGSFAKKMSYQPIPGFSIKKHIKGNFHPQYLVFGKWQNIERREGFLSQIVDVLPDFHERRRDIWSYFGMRYYELSHNLSLKINRDKYHIATAYWFKTKDKSSDFYIKWKEKIKQMGGDILIELKGGKSPFGYQYNPDSFVITSWDDEADFKIFQEYVKKLKMNNIEYINEFVLE